MTGSTRYVVKIVASDEWLLRRSDGVCIWNLSLEGDMEGDHVAHAVSVIREATEEITTLRLSLAAMTEDRDLWQGQHNDDCPNLARFAAAEKVVDAVDFAFSHYGYGAKACLHIRDALANTPMGEGEDHE